MKILLLLFCAIFFYFEGNAQENKTVTLVVSGQGKTLDDAKQNALRSAIEQAFGAFISSKTEILNDELVRDEIVSVSSGNIQKYEIISETLMPGNMGFVTTIKSTISISKLTSFCESKGMKIEIKGALFAYNVIQKELSATNESKVIDELVTITERIAPKMFDYRIISYDPKSLQNGSYFLPIKVVIEVNNNWESLGNLVLKTLSSLSLDKRELEDYKTLNLKYYSFDNYCNQKKFSGKYYFREYGYSNNLKEEQFDNLLWGSITKGVDGMPWNQFRLIPKGIKIKDDKLIHIYSKYRNLYKLNNFDESNFYFRTDIGSKIHSICEIINQEALNFNFKSTEGENLSFQAFNFFFPPISIERSDYKTSNAINRIIYADRDVYQNLFYYQQFKKIPYFFIKQIESNSIIGYSYCYKFLSLDQIKTLSEIEIKHNY
jgi:hypothetical protein